MSSDTGRLSSSDPNLQNIPIRTPLGREIRKGFVADAVPGDEACLSRFLQGVVGFLVVQPIFDLATGEITQFEVLLRMVEAGQLGKKSGQGFYTY